MDPLRHIKPAVRDIKAYTLAARKAAVKINQNENPWDIPQTLKRRVLDHALVRPWSRYPDFDPKELTSALARSAGWKEDGTLAGNGSNELIEALLLVTLGPGAAAVIPEPTFTLYAHLSGILGADVVRVPLTQDLEYDTQSLVAARKERDPAVTIVCSPNNPTGTVLSHEDLGRLCAASDGLVVLDEAYHEFSGETVVPLLADHPNLVVLRTFSKALGMAGLRVGYLMASPDLVREINKARLPYNLNFFAQAAALAALQESAALGAMVARLVEERERLLARLGDMPGVKAWPSKANFVLLELEAASPKGVFEALYRRGVLVRDVSSYPMLSRCLRVSVGTPDENDTFLHALGTALGETGVNVAADTGRA